jgi:hypothetical protein
MAGVSPLDFIRIFVSPRRLHQSNRFEQARWLRNVVILLSACGVETLVNTSVALWQKCVPWPRREAGWQGNKLIQRGRSTLVRRRCLVQISAETLSIYIEVFSSFPQLRQANSKMTPRLDHYHFVPNLFRFFTHRIFYHLTMCGIAADSVRFTQQPTVCCESGVSRWVGASSPTHHLVYTALLRQVSHQLTACAVN